MALELAFDAAFAAGLAVREKQIQQHYRPTIGIHKWFARRPGTLFRNLLISEFGNGESMRDAYWRAHEFSGIIADPFMGGGTSLIEANRLGFHVVGADINPMAYWVVRQVLTNLDARAFARVADSVSNDIEADLGDLYQTRCLTCGESAPVKYFIWVKQQRCPHCDELNDLFPGYMLAKASRHPAYVLVCVHCKSLVETPRRPTEDSPVQCPVCAQALSIQGPARRNRVQCRACDRDFRYPEPDVKHAPLHRMWALEYSCQRCRPNHAGRFFKAPDSDDFQRVQTSTVRVAAQECDLPIPSETVPPGDETDRLHRWGYHRYRDMFTARQLLGLGSLLRRIGDVGDSAIRQALLTVFSDSLRYQNMLCRYDTDSLKCQDIFSVHGFPVGLIQCENNLLGIPGVGAGGFRHFVEKYLRAKSYCASPFETRQVGRQKQTVVVPGESIAAQMVDRIPDGTQRQAYLVAASATAIELPPASLDGVFTDPPYFDNVQYAELMDFCFVWLRQGLGRDLGVFRRVSTRTDEELTGNVTRGRDLAHFTEGLARVFAHYAAALKESAPFVFTYHHNDVQAYAPLVVAMLDADLACTATLPAPAEMEASLHIARTSSSTIDSVFVCRRVSLSTEQWTPHSMHELLIADCRAMETAGIIVSEGDVRCLAFGHLARYVVNRLAPQWESARPTVTRLAEAQQAMTDAAAAFEFPEIPGRILSTMKEKSARQLSLLEAPVA